MLRTGVDLVEINRIKLAAARYGNRFLERLFTPMELEQCCGRMESLAGRFAAKEAAAKSLGTGIWRDGIRWTDIEVVRDPAGAPILRFHGPAAARAAALGLQEWSVSLSHDRERAVAMVVALGA
jgi:holo-[acyl-carrier protein] synthase